ncbi:MAG TPA: type II secretion system protein GspG [Thermoanaerobaculia bacterium]|nr:type II secretion system protein GspG [Thermoanaerobaculia bacterium]
MASPKPVILPRQKPYYVPLNTSRKTAAQCCQCPACLGLECLERPRYFAGQLLTEAELNSEQSYVIAKNRLHNRYLHGWGVVCGLEVVCHNCDGFVTVRAGYALDPCGNDVIVCKDTELNILDAIQKCVDARRKSNDDCPPWRDPNDTCSDDDQHWCVTLQYVENEGRSVMPLQETKSHCGCGGKCGGGGGCGCGGNGNSKKNGGCSCGATKAATPKKTACEPTRIFEQYRLGIIPEPDECASRRQMKSDWTTVTKRYEYSDLAKVKVGANVGLFSIQSLIPGSIRKHPLFPALVAAAPDDSIFMRAIALAQELEDFLAQRFSARELEMLRAIGLRCRYEQAYRSDEHKKTLADLRAISVALEAFNTDRNSYPVEVRDFEDLRDTLSPTYMKEVPQTDGWGTAYHVVVTKDKYRIISAGEDRKFDASSERMDAPPNEDIVIQNSVIVWTGNSTTYDDSSPAYQLCCKFRRAIKDLYAENPLNVRCVPFDCPPCAEDPTNSNDERQIGASDEPASTPNNPMCCLIDALTNYYIDALCMLFLPGCPKPPCEDRVIIACVTVQKGKIVHICNHACRHYAGSFNSVQHWMSVLPVIPLIGAILRDVCCSENGFDVLLGLSGSSRAQLRRTEEGVLHA